MYRALVLVTSHAQADEFQRHLVGTNYGDVHFRYPACIARGEQTPTELLADCRELLGGGEDEDDVGYMVDAIVNIFPGLELVLTTLGREFPSLRTASFEAAFVCGHRYYSRQMALQGFNCDFGMLYLEDTPSQESIVSLFEDTGCPINIIDNFRLGKVYSRQIRSIRQFYRELPQIKTELSKTHALWRPLLKSNLPKHKYPLGYQLSCVVEEAFDPAQDAYTTHYVEGCVMDGDVTPWVISDVLTWPANQHCVQAVAVPTRLDNAAQFQLWAVFREVLDNLRNLAFDNSFLTVKVSVHDSGRVRVLDACACVLRGSPMLYRHVYQQGDNIRAQVNIATGQMLSHPKLLGGRFAMRANLTTFKKAKAGELLNYKAIKELPRTGPQLQFLPPEDEVIQPDPKEGFILAEINILSVGYMEACEQMKELALKVMRDTDDCPWAS